MRVCMLMTVVPGMQISSGVVPEISTWDNCAQKICMFPVIQHQHQHQHQHTRASSSCPAHCWTLLRLGFDESPKLNLRGRMEAAAREGRIRKERESILQILAKTFANFLSTERWLFFWLGTWAESATYKLSTDQTVFSVFSSYQRLIIRERRQTISSGRLTCVVQAARISLTAFKEKKKKKN